MILHSPKRMKNSNFVMPAWIAGIQICKDASGNIHVNLDSSASCWNDRIDGPLLEVTEAPLFPYFQRRARRARRFVIVVYESFAVDFFSALNPAKTFFNPSEIENFYRDVIGIQQNCQLHGSNLPLHHVAQLALVSYCHSHFHLFQC